MRHYVCQLERNGMTENTTLLLVRKKLERRVEGKLLSLGA